LKQAIKELPPQTAYITEALLEQLDFVRSREV
jgi:hypothetical protein